MSGWRRAVADFVPIAAALVFAGHFAIVLVAQAEDGPSARHLLTYSVSARAVAVVSAVTPYDRDPEVRDAFLRWFKRGFDTVLAGDPPLMIEWNTTAKGRAGRSGYDFGMDEAERFLKHKLPDRSPHTVPIPPA